MLSSTDRNPRSHPRDYRKYDLSVLGRNHLDYIIAIPLHALREVYQWMDIDALDKDTSPGVERMIEETGILRDHAIRLHEVLTRMKRFVKYGRQAFATPYTRIGRTLN